jgi:hypothetical protein
MFFLEYPFYTAAAGRLSRVTEDLTTQGTLFTFGTPPSVVPTYNGSITVVTAQQDVIMCAVSCTNEARDAGANQHATGKLPGRPDGYERHFAPGHGRAAVPGGVQLYHVHAEEHGVRLLSGACEVYHAH